MTRYISVFTLLAVLTACTPVQIAPSVSMQKEIFSSKNWNVAVLDFNYEFEGEGNVSGTNYVSAGKDGGRVVADLLSAELVRLDNVTLIERSQISKVLDEQALQQSGAIKTETAASVGKLVGADAVVMGELTDYVSWSNLAGYGSTISFSMRMIEAETGKVIMNGSISRVRQFIEPFPNAQLTTKELIDSIQKN